MSKSHTTPSLSYFFMLICLAVMVFTAVKIWDQLPKADTHHQVAQATKFDSTAANAPTPVVSPTPTTTPKAEVFRPQRFGAEIRAEVVLTRSETDAANSISETHALESLPEESLLFSGPAAIDIPSEVPELLGFDLDRGNQGLNVPPAMELPPIESAAEFNGDVAIPPLERVAKNIKRTQPMVALPTTVATPQSPASIEQPVSVEQPASIEPVAESPVVPPETQASAEPAAEITAEPVANTLLPLPPIRTGPPVDDVTTNNVEPVESAPELPPLDPIDVPIDPAVESVAVSTPRDAPFPPAITPESKPEETTSVRDEIQAARAAARAKKGGKRTEREQVTTRHSPWPKLVALDEHIAELQSLRVQAGTENIVAWSTQIATTLAALRQSSGLNTVDTKQPLAKLRYLVEHTPQVNDSRIQSRVMVTRYAVQRRLAVWQSVQASMQPEVAVKIERVHSNPDNTAIVKLTRGLRSELGEGAAARNWNQFLMLDDIERLALSAHSSEAIDRARIASRLLERMNREQLTPVQRSVMQSAIAKELQFKLKSWSTANMDYRQWLNAIEQMEANPTFRQSDALVDMATQLKWSHSGDQNQLASTFYSHYRNANARLAVTELVLNRMLPIIRDSKAPVREEILGARVFGNSASWTKIGLDLIPDNHRLRMKLVANGNVNMQTRSFKGPAVVFNRNQSHFHLQKMITCDEQGVHIGKSTTTASTKMKILGLRTEYDGVPLLGSIARRKAQQQINEQRNLAKRMIERRVANQAQTKVDTQLTQQLFAAQQRLEEKLVQPMRQLQLDPTTISLETTQNRMVYRGRLAAEHHLAAFTPRPNALANSVVSLQLHESAINNAIERMRVDGRRGDLRAMLEEAANSRPNAKFQIPEDVPDGVTLELAKQDAIRMRWHDGKMRITIRVAEIAFKRRSWKNFTVSANYRPRVSGLEAKLYRDGVVELIGEKRLTMRDQVALRGIFGKVFSKNRDIPLMPANLAKDHRLADLHVTQFMIRDGWVGVSVGRQVQNVARQRGSNNRYRR